MDAARFVAAVAAVAAVASPRLTAAANCEQRCMRKEMRQNPCPCCRQGAPIVVKANGLAAGKGVVVAQTLEEAYAAVDDMMTSQVWPKCLRGLVVLDCTARMRELF
eukprot:352218-Chlamydomonas_euryale.AAC.1